MTKVIRARREVIAGKLLAALDDSSKVAILASDDDLQMIITALEYAVRAYYVAMPKGWHLKRREMIEGLRRLQTEAFRKK